MPLRERFLLALDRLVLGLFFRRIEVEGAERVSADGPLLIVANHVNGLLDPMLVLGCLPRIPRFLAKSTLWEIPLLRPFLALARPIPVHRPTDPGADPARNAEAFAAAREVLAAGGAVALFPEGRSHDEPALAPLKTGAARIVLEAVAARPGLAVDVLPVGLVFDAKERFRSRALVEVGDPFALTAADGPPADPEAVRAATARIEAGLQTVTVNYASWQEARLVARAAQVWARPALDVPRHGRLATRAAVQRAFAAGYRDLAARHPDRAARVAARVQEYDRLLAAAGLRDEQVASAYALPPVARFLRRTLSTVLLRFPLALLGTALNALPYQVVSLVVHRVRTLDQKATWKVFGALVLYPLTWVAEAVAAGLWIGGVPGLAAGAAVLVLAPVAGAVALPFHDRGSRLLAETRAFLLLRTRGRFADRLRAERAELREEVAELVELWRGEVGGGESSLRAPSRTPPSPRRWRTGPGG